jgi:hypothetical protein
MIQKTPFINLFDFLPSPSPSPSPSPILSFPGGLWVPFFQLQRQKSQQPKHAPSTHHFLKHLREIGTLCAMFLKIFLPHFLKHHSHRMILKHQILKSHQISSDKLSQQSPKTSWRINVILRGLDSRIPKTPWKPPGRRVDHASKPIPILPKVVLEKYHLTKCDLIIIFTKRKEKIPQSKIQKSIRKPTGKTKKKKGEPHPSPTTPKITPNASPACNPANRKAIH